ncbi:MAG: hypothetical protein Q9222_002165 [Ikaeria aurantiellina]
MDDIPPSYEHATQREHWTIIAHYVLSSDDLCAASRVCKRWHQIFAPLLWGNPASHFGTENDRVYVALTRFKRSLRWVRHAVRCLTHTLHLPPAQAELYDGPRPGWLRDVLLKLPNLQSLLVSQLPFFDHASLLALQTVNSNACAEAPKRPVFPLRLLIAIQCTNTAPRSLAGAMAAFPHLVFLDLSRTLGARDPTVLSELRHMSSLQILKLRSIQLRDEDMRILAGAIGIRVRSLDVRSNLLTDHSVRTLLHLCFRSVNDSSGTAVDQFSSTADEDWPSGILRPDPAMLGELRDESFSNRYLKRLTQGPVSRLPSEDFADAGITHLYVAENHLTVEGLSSLIKSARLHVLDAGAVDTARVFRQSISSSSSPLAANLRTGSFGLPGAEKLILVLARSAHDALTSLRLDHSVVTGNVSIETGETQLEPGICELSSDSALEELDTTVASPVCELPSESSVERSELPGDSIHFVVTPALGAKPDDQALRYTSPVNQESINAPEVLQESFDSGEHDAPVLTATGLSPDAQAINGVQISKDNIIDKSQSPNVSPLPSSPQLSLSIITKQRQDFRLSQVSQPHGLLPFMLPNLRSFTLTDVPCYDSSGVIIDALVTFIQCCASEAELAKQQATLESKYSFVSQGRESRPVRQAVDGLFALRRITLEMRPLDAPRSSLNNLPGSPGMSKTSTLERRTKSSTEDADSEAFWTAQQNDFSFFDDDEECGLPSNETASRSPLPTISEKMTLPMDNPDPSALPTLQHPSQRWPGRDVVQELVKFRRERKAAHDVAVKHGRPTVEGYWPGEVKVVRVQGGDYTETDYYGNRFEHGYVYR